MKLRTQFVIRSFFLFSLLGLTAFSTLYGQDKITVSGTVYESDADGRKKGPSIPFAKVVCAADQTGANTDDDGKFSFQVTRRDTVRIVITYEDRIDYKLDFSPVEGNSKYDFEILMREKISESAIGDVVITAGKFEQRIANVPVSMVTVKPKAIDLQASNSIEKVLEQVPGVDIRDGQPQIRGSSGYAYGAGSRVMVMLDGLPLLSADAAFAQFDMIPSDNIQQIEIMKGASSVLYGSSALGGVINVITGEPNRKPKTSVRMKTTYFDSPKDKELDWDGNSAATINSIHVFHSRKIGRHDFTALLDLVEDSGFRKGTGRKQVRPMIMTKFRPKKVDGLNLGFNTSYKRDSSGSFLYWGSYHPDTTVRSWLPRHNFPPVSDSLRDTVFSGGALTGYPGTQRYQLNTRLTLDPFLQYLDSAGRLFSYRGRILQTRNQNSTNQSSTNRVYYNDFQYLFPVKEWITWVAGATATVNTVNADTTFYDGGSHLSYSLAGYTQVDGKFIGEKGKEKLNLSAGARFERVNINPGNAELNRIVQAPIFRLGAAFEPVRGTNLRASFGQAFRSPSVAELYTQTVGGGLIIEPNPDLRKEQGYSVEIGVKQGFRFGDTLGLNPGYSRGIEGFLDIAVFRMQFQDMIEFGLSSVTAPSPGSIFPSPNFSARNVTDARIDGAEITGIVNGEYYGWNFNLSGGITLLDPQNLNPTPDSLQVVLDPYAAAQQGLDVFQQLNGWGSGTLADNPAFLKYRSAFSGKFSTTVGWKKVSLSCNYRYNSQIETVDQFLLLAVPQSGEFVGTHGGQEVVDFILGYDFTSDMRLSFHIDNAFNEEYVVIPGIMAEQRRFTLQYKYVF